VKCSISDINELNLPKTCNTEFPDADDLLTFKLIICPDEVRNPHKIHCNLTIIVQKNHRFKRVVIWMCLAFSNTVLAAGFHAGNSKNFESFYMVMFSF
jgi:hypothetical protein